MADFSVPRLCFAVSLVTAAEIKLDPSLLPELPTPVQQKELGLSLADLGFS